MEFFELKLIEKIGQVFSIAMHDRKYNRYQFIKKWCFSNTCQAVFDFDETLCSQAKSYILRTFEKEYQVIYRRKMQIVHYMKMMRIGLDI